MSERLSRSVSFTGGTGAWEVQVGGVEPASTADLADAERIYREDYAACREHGAPTQLTSGQLADLAYFNASLPSGSAGAQAQFYKGEIHPTPKRKR